MSAFSEDPRCSQAKAQSRRGGQKRGVAADRIGRLCGLRLFRVRRSRRLLREYGICIGGRVAENTVAAADGLPASAAGIGVNWIKKKSLCPAFIFMDHMILSYHSCSG